MPIPVPPAQVTYRHLPPSPAITARILSEVAKLAHHRKDLTSCSVTVETPDRHHQHGRHFRIAIELILPGGVILVDHQPSARRALLQRANRAPGKQAEVDATHRDAYVTIRDAFDVRWTSPLAMRVRQDKACSAQPVRSHSIGFWLCWATKDPPTCP